MDDQPRNHRLIQDLENQRAAIGRSARPPQDMIRESDMPRLADPAPDNGASKLATAVTGKIDEATIHITEELDRLIQEIEAIKARVIEEAGVVKEAIQAHLELGAEAMAFTSKVRTRLGNLRK